MMMEIVDDLETKVREFLTDNPEGGRFSLPELDPYEMAIPLVMGIFEDEGWRIFYDNNDDGSDWLNFEKPEFNDFVD